MKAVVYDFTKAKYVAAKALGKQFPTLYYGKPSALSLRHVEEPKLPNKNWVKVKPILSGVCGSDMGAICYKTSPSLTPFNSFPSVLGHEVVGIVTEVGDHVNHVEIGQRITIDPYITCEVRERKNPCIACKEGRSEEHTSELQSRGHLVCRLLLEKKTEQTDTRTTALTS